MSATTPCPVWLDCDPGHDDAFAILFAAHHPSLNLLGISTVHGNSSLPHTTHNALSLLTALGRPDIPVYPGAAESLHRPAVHAPAIHGESGLDGTDLLPEPSVTPREEPAIEAMREALMATLPHSAWLVATGALTNIALLFQHHPDVASHIKGLSIMGGALGNAFTPASPSNLHPSRIGNWSEHAEFNILVDPEAAAYLFAHPVLKTKTTLIPLDVTHLVLATPHVQSLLLWGKSEAAGIEKEKEGNKGASTLRRMLVELLVYFANTYATVFGITAGPPLHDPLAVATILDGIAGVEIPFYDFVEGGKKERYAVHVVTDGSHDDALKGAETGRTIATLLEDGKEGIKIPRGLDVPRFWKVLEECLERADEVNKAKSTA
ncbi:nucleoside hydrolase [Tricladium varicosporioides]|nr:nucleoside hydrolase [Hymenoscyphus varicosporioides]